jgi:uncharacterized protein (TIGR02246 family)
MGEDRIEEEAAVQDAVHHVQDAWNEDETTSIGAEARAADESAIRHIVQKVQEGWNAGDGAAFAAPFAEDADYVIVNGAHIKGRAVIGAGHQQIFDTVYKGSHNTLTVEDIRFLRSDVAVARVLAHLQFGEQTANARSTWVLTKAGGAWQVAAFQNTAVTPPGPPPGE